MSVVVLDTNVVSYLLKGHRLAVSYRPRLEGQTLAIAFMTVAELDEGALRAGWGEPRIARLNAEVRKYLVIPASPRVCWHWGDIRAGRRAQPISVDDAWIAACARAHDWALVTHNPRDFDGIPELRVVTGEGPRDSTGQREK